MVQDRKLRCNFICFPFFQDEFECQSILQFSFRRFLKTKLMKTVYFRRFFFNCVFFLTRSLTMKKNELNIVTLNNPNRRKSNSITYSLLLWSLWYKAMRWWELKWRYFLSFKLDRSRLSPTLVQITDSRPLELFRLWERDLSAREL